MNVLERIASHFWQDQQKTVEVIRNGEQQVISSFDLVVWRSFPFLLCFIQLRLGICFSSRRVWSCLPMVFL